MRLFQSENIVGGLTDIFGSERKLPDRSTIDCSIEIFVVAADRTDHSINAGKRTRFSLRKDLQLHNKEKVAANP
jgi:hypothetical protein